MVSKTVDEKIVSQPDMSIVMVAWNNLTYLDPCLKSLYEAGLKYPMTLLT